MQFVSLQFVSDFGDTGICAGLVLIATDGSADANRADRIVAQSDRYSASDSGCTLNVWHWRTERRVPRLAASPDDFHRDAKVSAVYALRRLKSIVCGPDPSSRKNAFRRPLPSTTVTLTRKPSARQRSIVP